MVLRAANNPHTALKFITRDCCQSWCDSNPFPKFAPQGHVFDFVPGLPIHDQTPMTDFVFSVRTRNALKKMNIVNVGDLMTRSEDEFLANKFCGEKCLEEIKQNFERLGWPKGFLKPQEPRQCECPIQLLLTDGCKCGGC